MRFRLGRVIHTRPSTQMGREEREYNNKLHLKSYVQIHEGPFASARVVFINSDAISRAHGRDRGSPFHLSTFQHFVSPFMHVRLHFQRTEIEDLFVSMRCECPTSDIYFSSSSELNFSSKFSFKLAFSLVY